MQTQTQAAVARPRAYWWIAVLALVWNLIGLAMFFSQMLMDGAQVMQLSEAQRAVYLATPGWVNLAFAFAVIAGVLGALCLLLRRRLAAVRPARSGPGRRRSRRHPRPNPQAVWRSRCMTWSAPGRKPWQG